MFTPPAGMLRRKGRVPSFVAQASNLVGGGNGQMAVNKPTGTVSGDTMVFFYWGRSNTTFISSAPAGWTQDILISPTIEGTQHYGYLFHRVAGGSEPGNYVWNLSGGNGEKNGVILTYRPTSATQLDVVGLNDPITASSNTHTQSSMALNLPDGMLVYGWLLNRFSNSLLNLGGWTIPAGMTQRYQANFNTLGRPDVGLAIYDEQRLAVGSVGARTLITADADVASYGLRCVIRG